MEKMRKQIHTAILNANTLQEAVQAVRALEQSSKELHDFINEPIITKDIVGSLAAKFGGYRESIAQLLATQDAKQYVQR